MDILKSSLVAFVIFIILDIIWLGFVARDFFFQHLMNVGRIQDGKFQLIYWAAAAVYIFMAIGLSLYILPSLSDSAGFLEIFFKGALYGLIVYGIYDMTNLATLKDWSLTIAAVDMSWGAFLGGATTYLTKLVLKFI